MRERFKDVEHLVRLVVLFAAGIVAFVVIRAILVPDDFGRYGHFRAGALGDVRAAPLRHAGRELCETCHDDVAEQRAGSAHAAIACEGCHGPLADHADDPEAVQPQLPERQGLCLGCHGRNVARPNWFPQVDPEEHADGEECSNCHEAHHPEP